MTENTFNANRAVISLSGGLDSTMLLMHLLSKGMEVRAYSFYYGQKHNVELKKVKKNIKFLQEKGLPVTHQIINLEDCFSGNTSSLVASTGEAIPHGHYTDENMKSTVVPLRNVIFSSIVYSKAINWAVQTGENIFITLGLHAGDHCFTEDTVIFTPSGYKTVSELRVGDEIYSFDGDNLKTEITHIQDIIHKGVNDTIYNIKTTSGNIKLTSEHKVYVCELNDYDNKFGYNKTFSHKLVKDLQVGDKLITPFLQDTISDEDCEINITNIVKKCLSDNVDKYSGYNVVECGDQITISSNNGKNTLKINSKVSAEKLLELMAWYITEGWSSNQWKTNKQASRFMSSISQSLYKNFANCDSIQECIQYFGCGSINTSKVTENDIPKEITYNFNSVLSVLMSSCGNSSSEKKIPEWIMNLCNEHPGLIRNFVYTLVCGDGHYDKVSGMYSYITNSDELMRNVSYLVKKLGYFVKVTHNDNKYTLYFGNKNKKQGLVRFGQSALTEITGIEIIKHETPVNVYDLSVEKNHNFFAGDNGNILISNSIYPDCRPESQEACKHAFEISDWNSDKVEYVAPFVNIDKGAVLGAGLYAMQELGFSKAEMKKILKNTHTCYDPNEKGESCGLCGSCTERLEAFAANGMKDPVKYSDQDISDNYWREHLHK